MLQQEWHGKMVKDLFGAHANFRKERRKRRTVYNGRSAFVKHFGLNAVTVKPSWGAITSNEIAYWALEAIRLNDEAADHI